MDALSVVGTSLAVDAASRLNSALKFVSGWRRDGATVNLFLGWQIERQSANAELKSAGLQGRARSQPELPGEVGSANALSFEALANQAGRTNENCSSSLRLTKMRLSEIHLRDVGHDLRLAVQDIPVQAAADYSVDYGKQVFFGVMHAARKWHADDASAMAAGVAYYLALSLFPMLLLLTAGLGMVFRFTSLGHDAELQILSIVAEHCSPTLEAQVRDVLSQLREQSLVGGPFGLVTAVMAAIGVFYRFERAFDRIWKVNPPADANWQAACVRIIRQRFNACLLLASVGVSILVILLANVAVGFVHAWMAKLHIPGTIAITAVDACATLLLNAAVFGMLYQWLPKRRILWVDAFRGGLLAALVWEAGRQLLGAVLIGVRYTTAYGAIGSFIAMLLWCYWGVSIIFFGAEYAQVLSDLRRESHEKALTNEAAATVAHEDEPDRGDAADAVAMPAPTLPFPTIPRRVA